MKTACLSSAYLGPISYYTKLFHYQQIEIETGCTYMKQTYRNRCNILGANGIMPLSIPVEKPYEGKILTRDMRISDHGNWRHLHWNAIVSAYNSTPFFEYYADDFHPFYERKYNFLIDYNQQLCQLICELIGFTPRISINTDYRFDFSGGEKDFREIIHPKKRMDGADNEFISRPYYQVFSERFGFVPDMAIIDLLFNMGPESLLILKQSYPTE